PRAGERQCDVGGSESTGDALCRWRRCASRVPDLRRRPYRYSGAAGFVSHVERLWEEPRCRAFQSALAEVGRLILLDRRGVGLSDRVGFTPSVDATAQDIATVLNAAGCRRIVLLGASEGGPACIKFAADHPDRVAGLILFASLAKGSATPDYPHALQASQYDV